MEKVKAAGHEERGAEGAEAEGARPPAESPTGGAPHGGNAGGAGGAGDVLPSTSAPAATRTGGGGLARRLLVSNDDGIDAPGVLTLLSELARHPDRYEVVVACPSEQQSAQSHAVTLFKPLWAEPYILKADFPFPIPAWRVAGTPTDCVKVALTSGLLGGWKPDLLVSGINAGSNTGLNVIYSGTCAAALEACIYGIPSVALSLDFPSDRSGFWHYAQSAEYAVRIIDQVLADQETSGRWTNLCCNVNFPNVPKEQIKGFKLVCQGPSRFVDCYVEQQLTEEERSLHPLRRQFRLEGKFEMRDTGDDEDSFAMRAGWIAVNPISAFAQNSECVLCSKHMRSWPCFNSTTK